MLHFLERPVQGYSTEKRIKRKKCGIQTHTHFITRHWALPLGYNCVLKGTESNWIIDQWRCKNIPQLVIFNIPCMMLSIYKIIKFNFRSIWASFKPTWFRIHGSTIPWQPTTPSCRQPRLKNTFPLKIHRVRIDTLLKDRRCSKVKTLLDTWVEGREYEGT